MKIIDFQWKKDIRNAGSNVNSYQRRGEQAQFRFLPYYCGYIPSNCSFNASSLRMLAFSFIYEYLTHMTVTLFNLHCQQETLFLQKPQDLKTKQELLPEYNYNGFLLTRNRFLLWNIWSHWWDNLLDWLRTELWV